MYLREDGKGSGPEVREQKSISQVKEGKIDHNLKTDHEKVYPILAGCLVRIGGMTPM